MPYKDPEKQREYQREWAQRKKEGKPTAIKRRRPSAEQTRQRKNSDNRRYRAARRVILRETFGKDCYFCHYNRRLIAHNKKGSEHPPLDKMKKQEFLDFVDENKDNFVILCFKCHKHVHWCMKYLGLEWETMVALSRMSGVQISPAPPPRSSKGEPR